MIDDLAVGARFLRDLPGFLRRSLTIAEAREVVRERLRSREARFLGLVREAVYASPASPYRVLLERAGCEPGDLARVVRERGVEGALRSLVDEGVYLTVDELKRRRPVVRGPLELRIEPRGLVNPRAIVHGVSETSGSGSGARQAVPIDLAFVRDHAVNTLLFHEAHGGTAWTHAHFDVPGGTAVTHQLELCVTGTSPTRWFTPVRLTAPGIHARYRLGTPLLRLGARLGGARIPSPAYAPLSDPEPVAAWMQDVLGAGGIPHVRTFASSAVAVAQAAADRALDLAGARFTGGGEPTTAGRLAAVRAVGAELLPRYGATETDVISYGCAAPVEPDDQHLLHDRHAVIAVEAPKPRLPRGALLFTSLLPSAPFVLLNAALGDRAVLRRRACGCPLEELGWEMHVHTIRSFEKLTAAGVSLLDTDVTRVLEEVLPARFGGSVSDYQLAETEDADGALLVRLRVHPRVGPLDEAAVAGAFRDALADGPGGERIAELQWRSAGLPRVERAPPAVSATGKVLHVHRG